MQVGPEEVRLGPDLTVSVDPRIELLGAALAQTPWGTDNRNPGFVGGPYTQYLGQLKDWAQRYRGGPAVKRLEDLRQNRNFVWDAPPHLMLEAQGGLALRRPDGGWCPYLVGRAGSNQALNDQAVLLGNLAAEGAFDKFFEDHRPFYKSLIDRQTKGFPADRILAWMRGYFGGGESLRFHLILAPGLEPAGGYGATIGDDVYQIVRDAERSPTGYLGELTLHEFGHHFVNPAVGDHVPPEARGALEAEYQRVAALMRDNTYGEFETYLNELVLRATVIRGQVALGLAAPGAAGGLLASEESIGFRTIRRLDRELQDYEAHRDRWPTFAAFAPELLKRLARL